MKVKIGDKIYDANEEPIMLILNDVDKENINNMDWDATKYIAFPKDMSQEDLDKFMEK